MNPGTPIPLTRLPYSRRPFFVAALIMTMSLIAMPAANPAHAQSGIVLRDLTRLEDRTVKSYSQESIVLDDGSQLTWDQVLKADLGDNRQAEFDRNIRDIGLPLFRMNRRIQIGDWSRLNAVADSLMIRYSGIDSPTGKAVCLAAAKGKLESLERAAAVVPFVMACHKRASLDPDTARLLNFSLEELQAGVSLQLLPVWFDLEQVRKQLPILEGYAVELEDEFPAGGYLYLASFHLALGQPDKAKLSLKKVVDLDPATRQWKRLLVSQADRDSRQDPNRMNLFQVNDSTMSGPRAVSAYLDAVALDRGGEAKPESVILSYLKVAALWGEDFPNLTASAIYRSIEVADQANMVQESNSLSAELLRRYAKSYHGRRLKNRTSSSGPD